MIILTGVGHTDTERVSAALWTHTDPVTFLQKVDRMMGSRPLRLAVCDNLDAVQKH